MAYFRCTTGGSGKGNTLVVTCADDLAGATITCTNGTKTYTKTCPSTAPYEVTFYGLEAGTWTVSATVSGNTYTATVVITDYEAELGGFSWRRWVDTATQLDSTDYASLSEVLADEEAVRELCLEHACVDYLADIATANEDVETIINNDLFAKWVNNSDYALDFLGANVVIKALMDEADKYGYGEWCLMPQVPKMTSNTAPYGVARNQSSETGYEAYRAFDNNDSTYAVGSSTASTGEGPYISYEFVSPVNIRRLYHKYSSGSATEVIVVKYSDDGSTWTSTTVQYSITTDESKNIDIPDCGSHRYWGVFRLSSTASSKMYAKTLQFYAYAPKGNVPIMTANNAPYGTASASNQNANAYQAFNGSDSGYNGGSSAYSGTITYAFTNPICPSKVSFRNNTNTDGNVRVYTYKVEGYDGTSWEDLTETLSVSDRVTVGALTEAEISTTKYYTQLRLNMLSGSQYIGCAHLQFYGRELSVSVPKMDTNTTPYGEASGNNVSSSSGAWQAFRGFDGAGYYSNSSPTYLITSDYVGYEFLSNVLVKRAVILFRYTASANSFKGKIQEYVNNEWVDISDVVTVNSVSGNPETAKVYVDLNPTSEGKKYRLYITQGATSGNHSGINLQFYGLDYSEKEFEEGTTKKWLYDHGVELVDIYTAKTGSAVVTKEENAIYMKTVNGQMAVCSNNEAIDLTSYNLIRAKNEPMVTTYATPVYAQIFIKPSKATSTSDYSSNYVAVGNFTNEIINTFGLDISAINTAEYIQYGFYGGNSYTENRFKELWLE